VTGEDWDHLGEGAERWTCWIGNRAYMRIEDGRCAALVRQGDRYACAIYDRRPEVCRSLERGSPECEGEIAIKGPRLVAIRSAR
jgi:Fe-S-cluster containining protein